MDRVLLLGGTGFIGSHVLDVLRARSDLRMMVLAHRRVDFRALEDVNLVTGTLPTLDLQWLDDFRPDTIIHLARLSGRGPLGRAVAARRGSRANERLIAWLRRHAPQTRVLYVSGTLVYGNRGDEPSDEETELNPTAYAREYVRAERPWMAARQTGTLPVILVRPPWVVGPGSWFHHYYALPAVRDGHTPLYGTGGNWMSFIDVRDCARAIVSLAERGDSGKVFNVFAPDQFAQQTEFVEALAARTGTAIRRVEGGALRRVGDRAAREALTSSFVASTRHDDLEDQELIAPSWPEMIDAHLPSA